MPAIPTTAYDELLAAGCTDYMAARYLRVPMSKAMKGMWLARYWRKAEAVGESTYPAELLGCGWGNLKRN